MRADARSLRSIFQGATQYVVPIYQRSYVWQYREDEPEKDRLGPFWEDVRQTVERLVDYDRLLASADGDAARVAPMAPHFFGAVVVDQPHRSPDGVTLYEVIDGQQRLTTAQLLIAASADTCKAAGRPRHASRLRRLCRQDDDLDLEASEALKLCPTRADRSPFLAALSGGSVPAGPVARAYEFFADQLKRWVAELPPDDMDRYFNALRDAIAEHLMFVLIELQVGDNPQGIFESLNAQGERLLAIDLVKNQVFRRARDAGLDEHRLEAESWSPEFARDWWREEVKQGRYTRPRAELFLMHWLTERTMTEVSATGLFVEFTRLFSHRQVGRPDVRGFVAAFLADARRYRLLELQEPGSREALFFARRAVLDVGVVLPLVLRFQRHLDESHIDRGRFLHALVAVESWLVRRMEMGLTTANYNRVVLDALRATTDAAEPVEALIGHLRSYGDDVPSAWWPDDVRWRDHLATNDVYRRLTRVRLRMLLEAAEARSITSKTEQVRFEEKLTIEHVIPQQWESTWPLPENAGEDAYHRREAVKHRLGNLTLVTKKLNPALSNDPWSAKREELAKHARLRLNAELVRRNPDHFDENVVDARGVELADLLIQEWPGPDSA